MAGSIEEIICARKLNSGLFLTGQLKNPADELRAVLTLRIFFPNHTNYGRAEHGYLMRQIIQLVFDGFRGLKTAVLDSQ